MGSIQCVKQRNFDNTDVSEDFNTHPPNYFDGRGDSNPFTSSTTTQYRCCCGLAKVQHRRQYSPVPHSIQMSNANQWPKDNVIYEEDTTPGNVYTHRTLPPDRNRRTRVCCPKSTNSNADESRNEAVICNREQLKQMLHKEKGKHDVPLTLENSALRIHGLPQPRDVTHDALKPQNSLHFFTTMPAHVFDVMLTLQHARRIGATRCHDRRMRIVETISGCTLSLSPVSPNDKNLPITVPQNHGVLRAKIVGRHKDNVLRALCELNSRMPELMRNAVAPKDASPVFSYVINHGCLSLTEQVAIQFPEILSRSSWLKPVKRKDQYSHRLLIEDCRRRIERR